MSGKILFLDRDGVLNRLVVHPELGTIDSPLNPLDVKLLPGVAQALAHLKSRGWKFAIVTNQPAAAKEKTTRAALKGVHARVLELLRESSAEIDASEICFHEAADECDCRKPAPGMLEAAWAKLGGGADRSLAWIAGDGIQDLEAGKRFGCKAAWLAPPKPEWARVLHDLFPGKDFERVKPDWWGEDLPSFSRFLEP